ncbi:MAG TPA: cytochrome c3 family protein [Candidatus Acidoferrum sp.]|nr:cytochrome c3 family protein [Candidatus Acidoferrum sp.]
MGSRVITLVLLVGIALSLLLLVPQIFALRLPGNQQGYEPVQPIAFSHRLHAGELQVACLYCHSGAEKSRHAGIPPANVCMNCHRFVTAPLGATRAEDDLARKEGRKPRPVISPELKKLFDALALDEKMQRDPRKEARALAWTKVHNVPDFVYFDHRPHVAADVACQQCHGPVEAMERVRQAQPLTMGWCVNCHREVARTGMAGKQVAASIDCSTCHY